MAADAPHQMKIWTYFYHDPLLDEGIAPTWGANIDRHYHDLGDRTQRQQLLIDCQAERPDLLLVAGLQDLGETMSDVTYCLKQLEHIGIPVMLVDADTPAGSTLDLVQTMQAEYCRRRIQRGHAQNRLLAKPPPGIAPYGYRRGSDRYSLDRSTAPVVKEFFDQFLLYGSVRGAVRYLASRYGKRIAVSTGRQWLTSPVYRGDLAYGTGQVILNTHSPIISREEAAQIDRLLYRNRALPRRSASALRSLSGLVFCADCNSAMTICSVTRSKAARRGTQPRQKSTSDYLYLRPNACPHQPKCTSVNYQAVLEQTIQRICEDLPKAVLSASLPDLDILKQGTERLIQQKQQVLNSLPDLVGQGILDHETMALRAYTLRGELGALQAKLAQFPPVNLKTLVPTVSLPQFWHDLSESERRFYFREFIRQIQIIREPNRHWHLTLFFIF